MQTSMTQVRSASPLQACAPKRAVSCQASGMETVQKFARNTMLTLAATATLMGVPVVAPPQMAPRAEAMLTAGDPIKNARAILRYALPIDNKPIRQIQKDLESISAALRIPGSKSLTPIAKSVRSSSRILEKDYNKIVAAFAVDKKADGVAALASLKSALADFDKVIAAEDKQGVPDIQQICLGFVGNAEEAMVTGFPFTVPATYANLPQLKGRAVLEMNYTLKGDAIGGEVTRTNTMVLDGYNAPVSAGCFMDLVNKKWYDGMAIQRADGFVVQTGKPEGKGQGYIDPVTKQMRTIPLEIKVAGEKDPIYEDSLEDLGRPNAQPNLPFNAFGTLAWARNEFETNSASSQVFWLLKESELTPSGANLLDGRFSVFGYITEGQDDLLEMKVGDIINYIKVVKGGENFQEPGL